MFKDVIYSIIYNRKKTESLTVYQGGAGEINFFSFFFLNKFYCTQSMENNVGTERIRELPIYQYGRVSKIFK